MSDKMLCDRGVMSGGEGDSHYEVLGVDCDASEGQIKLAFRALCKVHHPDLGGDEEVFQRISEAYGVLSDGVKREFYDLYGGDVDRQKSFDTALANLVLEALEAGGDVEAACRRGIERQRGKLAQEERGLGKQVEGLEKKLSRVKCSRKKDPVSELLNAKLAGVRADLEKVEDSRVVIDYVERNLSYYIFEPGEGGGAFSGSGCPSIDDMERMAGVGRNAWGSNPWEDFFSRGGGV